MVLDNVEKFTQEVVHYALGQVTEMSEKTYQFITKAF
jgi:hypothetical protein